MFPVTHSANDALESKHFGFDVVSIRPSGKDEQPGIRILSDGYEARAMPIESTISLAYLPAPYFKYQDRLTGAPSWVTQRAYDIEARIPPTDVNDWRSLNQNIMQTPKVLQTMLRAMLKDRFALIIHSSPAQVDGYALVLNGHRLRMAKESLGEPSSVPGTPLLDGGKAVRSMVDDKPTWTFYNTSPAALVGFLSLNASGPIEDRTGLQGKFHFTLSALEPEPTNGQIADEAVSDPDGGIPWDIGTLGLKLIKTKIPSTIWTIDHVQQPTPN
jgi:uncharacterized protein (TIGR03435 family)